MCDTSRVTVSRGVHKRAEAKCPDAVSVKWTGEDASGSGSARLGWLPAVDEHHVAVAAALKRARDAVAALAEPSPTFMDGMRSALQQADRRRCSSSREEGGRGGMN